MRGARTVGQRKHKLLMKLNKVVERVHGLGINTKFLMRNYLKLGDVTKLNTKQISGVIAQVTDFLRSQKNGI